MSMVAVQGCRIKKIMEYRFWHKIRKAAVIFLYRQAQRALYRHCAIS